MPLLKHTTTEQMQRLLVRIACAFMLSGFATTHAYAQPIADNQVVTTIAPIGFLVAGVMDGVGKPSLVFQANQSHHGAILKPSQVRLLAQAKIIFYIDSDVESGIQRVLADSVGKSVSLLDAPGVQKYKRRTDPIKGFVDSSHRDEHHDEHEEHDEHEAHEAHEEHEEHDEHGHAHVGVYDPHLWLSGTHAITMVHHIERMLAAHYPDQATHFNANARKMIAKIKKLNTNLQHKLSPVRSQSFMVFHDAFQYFAQTYSIRIVGALSIDPAKPLSARQLSKARAQLRTQGVVCILQEPQFNSEVVRLLADTDDIALGTVDPLGAGLPVSFQSYATLLNNITDTLVACGQGSNLPL